MLFFLIPIAWLAIIAIVVNACRAAAHGDEVLANASFEGAHRRERASWQQGPALTGMRHNIERSANRSQSRGVRSRGSRCATGS